MNNNQVALQKDITDVVSNKVANLKEEGLSLPKDYNYSNALKSAFFTLQKTKTREKQPVLQACTKESIANSLLNMVTQGLSPAKTQCYFIAYGDQLELQRSYFGTQTVIKRLPEVEDIWANVIFEGDDFDVYIDEKGRERLSHHKTSFLNRDNPIIGAYAIVETKNDGQILTAMTKKQLDTSWTQAKKTNVHNKFGTEMAKRTVINRAAKNFINTSGDNDMLLQAVNDTTENEYDEEKRRHDVTEYDSGEKSQQLLNGFKQQQEEKEQEETDLDSEVKPTEYVDYEEIEVKEAENLAEDTKVSEMETTENEEQSKETVDFSDVDFSEFTVDRLKSALDYFGVEYDSHARKPELVDLAESAAKGGESSEQSELF